MIFFKLLLIFFWSTLLAEIEQVIIWGHKLHTHTHSYVHYGFFKAFKALGYKTTWLDNLDDIMGLDFKNALFITEHQVDDRMPLREDCYYAVHNSTHNKYDVLKKLNHFIDLKVYRSYFLGSSTLKEIEPLIFYDVPQAVLIMPWATDLLPEEIEKNKPLSPLHHIESLEKKIYWVGTLGGGEGGNVHEITPFRNACHDAGVEFIHSNPWTHPISDKDNIKRIQESYLAPAICGTVQLGEGYIPCRIFKNISYGHIGMTNSKYVYEFFKKRIVYNPNSYQLFFDGQRKLFEKNISELYEMMDFIKENHTYLNRANHILKFINLLSNKN